MHHGDFVSGPGLQNKVNIHALPVLLTSQNTDDKRGKQPTRFALQQAFLYQHFVHGLTTRSQACRNSPHVTTTTQPPRKPNRFVMSSALTKWRPSSFYHTTSLAVSWFNIPGDSLNGVVCKHTVDVWLQSNAMKRRGTQQLSLAD